MISKDICISKDLLLGLGFETMYNLKIYAESCFRKNNVIVYLYPKYITVLVTIEGYYDHKLFYPNQLKEFISYVKKAHSNQ